MKKIITTFILLFGLISLNAQSIRLVNKYGEDIRNDTIVSWYAVDTSDFQAPFEFKKFVTVINNTTDTAFIGVTRLKLQGVTGTTDLLCWGSNCYSEPLDMNQQGLYSWTVNDSVIAGPMDTAAGSIPISVYINANKKVGEAFYEYVFYKRDSVRVSSSVTVNFSLSYLTGLTKSEVSEFGFNVFPNPATESSKLKFKTELNFREQYVEVLDISGKRISIEKIPVGAIVHDLNTDKISTGVYFVRLVAEGVQVDTKKIIIQ